MNKILYIAIILFVTFACHPNPNNSKKHRIVNDSLPPIFGRLSKEALHKYFPKITDTISDLRIIGSEKINLQPGNDVLISILHNTGTFDQMILCTFDKKLKLIDDLYIGKATGFDGTSHTISYKIIDNNNIEFHQVDYMQKRKGVDNDIDTLKYERMRVSINASGKIDNRIVEKKIYK